MKKNLVSEYKNLIYFTQIGLSVVSPILLCTGIGVLLQKRLDAPPAVMVLMILLGLASGLSSAWKVILRMTGKTENNKKRESEEQDDGN